MPSGLKCHSPALRGKAYCYYHTTIHRIGNPRSSEVKELEIPALEDTSSIKIALTQVIRALNSPFMDTRRAGLLLYGLQIGAQLTSRPSDQEPSQTVRTLCRESEGDVLAPEKTVCEPPADCRNCPRQETCENFEESDEDDDTEEDEQDDEDEEDEEEDQDELA
jgi:hypothetical protein